MRIKIISGVSIIERIKKMDNEKLLRKWLANELTDSERKEFEGIDDYALNKKIIDSARYFKAPAFSSEKSYKEVRNKIRNRKNTRVVKLTSFKTLVRIAAIFLIFFSFFALYRYNSHTTVETAAGQTITIELPDESSVTLNALSKITYPKYRWKNKRLVKLEGEAFFDVAKGAKFDVLGQEGTVSVLGTKFSVKNRENYFEVKCFEGLVNVNRKEQNQELPAGKTYRVLNNTVALGTTHEKSPDWLSNISSFDSVPLSEVLNEMERQYNVEISTQGINTQRLFTGSFVNNNLEQALLSVTVPFSFDFEIDDSNKITIYDSE